MNVEAYDWVILGFIASSCGFFVGIFFAEWLQRHKKRQVKIDAFKDEDVGEAD